MRHHKGERGSHVAAALIAVTVLAVIGLTGYKVMTGNKTDRSSGKPISWSFDMGANKWVASSTPPACRNPFVFDRSPVDVDEVTSILYPGQTRGGNYKAHGGFAFDDRVDNKVTVTMPYDAYLVGGARYYESGELQYSFDFVSECGIAIRLDHLATVSAKLQKLADTYLPAPKPDNSKGAFIQPPVLFKSGETLATSIGFSDPLNAGMDFGVYDYRTRNEASKNAAFQKAHGDFSATNYYGVCWFDMLPGPDAATVKSLPSRDQSMGKTSDFCAS